MDQNAKNFKYLGNLLCKLITNLVWIHLKLHIVCFKSHTLSK